MEAFLFYLINCESMLNKIIDFSIKNKLVIGLFTLLLVAFGAYEVTKLPIDAVPDITNNQVQVITVAPAYGATDIERMVTFPIEQANSNIKGIEEIRSISRFGLSVVTIVFDDETDVFWARQQVAERLLKVQSEIPQGVGYPELGPITTGLGEIYQYVVKPLPGFEKKYTPMDLRTLQDWVVRRQLLRVKGVAEVSSFGGQLKQYEIAIDPSKLQAAGITMQDVFTALENNDQNTGGAYIEKGPQVMFIRTEGLAHSEEEIARIAIKSTSSGVPVLIGDVAQVKMGYATRYGAMCYNDEGEVAGAVLMMLKGANSKDVIHAVKTQIEEIQKQLPPGVVIEAFLDRTKMVDNAIGTVEKNLMEGALIVVFILVLFLGNVRAGLLVASVIPLAMLFAIILMNLFGVSGNLMSLGALDFGLIVDGAVIIVEAVLHRLTHSQSLLSAPATRRKEMDRLVHDSAGRMMNSAVFGQIIILVVYLPIFTLKGIEGKMFKPMAQTVAFALVGAFVLSLTYIPMMSTIVLKASKGRMSEFSDRWMAAITARFRNLFLKLLHRPRVVASVVFSALLLAIAVMTQLGGEFIPALEEGDFAVECRLLPGSSLNTTIDYTQKAAGILKRKFPEVIKVITKIGSGEIPTDPMPMESADMMVILKDKKEWTSASSFNALADSMSKALREVPGLLTGFQYPVQMRFNELMTGARQDIVCKIFGENIDSLAAMAKRLGSIINEVDGAEDLYVEAVSGLPQVIVSYNRDVLSAYHLSISDVNKAVNIAFAGIRAGMIYEGERRFDLVVRLQKDLVHGVDAIRNLLIPIPGGIQVPLHELAEVKVKEGPAQIQREDASRRIVVGFNVRGKDVQTVVDELKSRVEREMSMADGYYVTYGGSFKNLNEAKQRLAIAVPVSLLLIFLLLYFAFGSIKHGLLIYTAIPLSAIGGVFALYLRGLPFSISAGVGFIALFGVSVLNGIVLISEFNRLKQKGMTNLFEIVLEGTIIRLRPVLMTAFVAALGFLPMAVSNGAGAEVQRPLATVVIGGLLLSTFLTLFVLPQLYVFFDRVKVKKVGPSITTVLLILMGMAFHAPAQTMTLQQTLDSAFKNNLTIKQNRLNTDAKKELIQSAALLPQSVFAVDAGQVNSAYKDLKFSIAQNFRFPSVYSRDKLVKQNEWLLAKAGTALSEADVRREVCRTFYMIMLLYEKEKLLSRLDSQNQRYVTLAEIKMNKGEISELDRVIAETQVAHIRTQLERLRANRDELLAHLAVITGIKSPIVLTGNVKAILAGSASGEHPAVLIFKAQEQVAKSSISSERAAFMPDLSLGYTNQSFRGVGPDNINYYYNTRFHSVQLSLGIPIFTKGVRSKISAAKLQSDRVAAERELQETILWNRKQVLEIQAERFSRLLTFFESSRLPAAQRLQEAASKQLSAGEINYMQWVLLLGQAVQVQTDYLDVLELYNSTIIELNYINAN